MDYPKSRDRKTVSAFPFAKKSDAEMQFMANLDANQAVKENKITFKKAFKRFAAFGNFAEA